MPRKGSRPSLEVPKGWIPHDGKSVPVPLDSQPGVKFRGPTKMLKGKRDAEVWHLFSGGSCWIWEEGSREPFDIIAYDPDDRLITVPFMGVAR